MSNPLPRSPITIDPVFEDPAIVRTLIERHGPYLPVQRYFRNQAEYEASSASGPMFIAPNFRGDWAYEKPLVEGVEPILHHEGFRDAAAKIFDCEIVRAQQVYCNLTWQLPFHQGGGHTDVPAFRGVDRTRYPTTLLSVMGQSHLFESYRVGIATAVAWFYEGSDGGFEYWPDGPDGEVRVHEGDIFNTAIVGDNDFMYHRVRPVGDRAKGLVQDMTLDTRLERVGDESWKIVEGDRELGSLTYPELRSSISWKATVFRDAEEARLYDEHLDDLAIEDVWTRFDADLEERGVAFRRPDDPLDDADWMGVLGRTYVRTPSDI